jgi:hypothetical protein
MNSIFSRSFCPQLDYRLKQHFHVMTRQQTPDVGGLVVPDGNHSIVLRQETWIFVQVLEGQLREA